MRFKNPYAFYTIFSMNSISKKGLALFFSLFSLQLSTNAQHAFSGLEQLFTEPKSYTLFQALNPLTIDGSLDEKSWTDAPWTDYFIDIEGESKPMPSYKTRVKMIWDDQFLYIAAQMEEPHIWANPIPKGDIIFKDNVFKIFIDPDNNMNDDFEIQINPLNKMLFLVMDKPYRDGGKPVSGWEPTGYQSAVKISGTLNNSQDTDKEWIAEIALPLAALGLKPQKQNAAFRINFLRTGFDFIVKNGLYSKALDSNGKSFAPHYASWTSQGIINMHYPERWAYGLFSKAAPNSVASPFILPYSEKQRKYLWLAYYRQKEFYKKTKQFAGTLQELNVPSNDIVIDGKKNKMVLEKSSKQFMVSISQEDGTNSISIDQDGLIIY